MCDLGIGRGAVVQVHRLLHLFCGGVVGKFGVVRQSQHLVQQRSVPPAEESSVVHAGFRLRVGQQRDVIVVLLLATPAEGAGEIGTCRACSCRISSPRKRKTKSLYFSRASQVSAVTMSWLLRLATSNAARSAGWVQGWAAANGAAASVQATTKMDRRMGRSPEQALR